MIIIEPGRPAPKYHRFTCDWCGCVFDAKLKELDLALRKDGVFFLPQCPCCGNVGAVGVNDEDEAVRYVGPTLDDKQ